MMLKSNILAAVILVVVAAAAAPPPATATPPPREGKFCSSPFAVAPDPADCARYFRCLDRKYYAVRCGAGLLFNKKRSYCDNAEAVECETSEFDRCSCCRPGRAAVDIGCIEDAFTKFTNFPRPSNVFASLSVMFASLFSGADVKVDKKYGKRKVRKTTRNRALGKMFSRNDAKSPKKKHV